MDSHAPRIAQSRVTRIEGEVAAVDAHLHCEDCGVA